MSFILITDKILDDENRNKEKIVEETSSVSMNKPGIQYELESAKPRVQKYDVIDYISSKQAQKTYYSYPALQPNAIKPIGSTDNYFADHTRISRRDRSIKYPSPSVKNKPTKSDNTNEKHVDKSIDQISRRSYSTLQISLKNNVEKISTRRCFSSYSKKRLGLAECRPKIVDDDCLKYPHCVQSDRADTNLIIKPKQLPALRPSTCPCIEPEIPSYLPKIRRLNLNFSDPPRRDVCEKRKECPTRADDGMVFKPKKLPIYFPGDCDCIEKVHLKDVPLIRLKPKHVEEPKRDLRPCCIVETCPPRADHNLEVKPKKLPTLQKSACPCIEPYVPRKNPPIRRLNFKFEDKPRNCPEIDKDCPPRADDNLKIKEKRLPVLKERPCDCVPTKPLKDVPLVRLKAKPVEEKPREVCIVPETCPERADDNLVLEIKKLPSIPISDCPCIEEEIPSFNPKIKKLNLSVAAPKRVCPSEKKVCRKRADDGYTVKPKKLPVYVPGECECIEKPQMVDVPLIRLKPKSLPEPKKVCVLPVDDCPPRADENLKVVKKKLPKIEKGSCPCVEEPVPTKNPKIQRLKKIMYKDYENSCTLPTKCDTPRADDNLIPKSKQLPIYTPGECPCIEPPRMVDVPLKRLKKKCDDEEPTYKNCDQNPRADKGCWEFSPTPILKRKHQKNLGSERKYSTKPFKCDSQKSVTSDLNKNNLVEELKISSKTNSLRSMSTVSVYKRNKKKKNVIKSSASKPCQNKPPKFKLKHCPQNVIRICGKEKADPIFCEKKSSPYPAFSEIMTTSLKPFKRNSVWQWNHAKCGFHSSSNKRTILPTIRSTQSSKSPKVSVVIRPKCTITKNNPKSRKSKAKKCSKFVLSDCPPKAHREYDCLERKPRAPCKKQTAPYPSFSDCFDQEWQQTFTECPMEKELRDAQPKSVVKPIKQNKFVNLSPKEANKFDPLREEECIRIKLKKPKKGITRTSENIDKPYYPMKTRDYFKPIKNSKSDNELKGNREFSSTTNTNSYHYPCIIDRFSNLYLNKLQSTIAHHPVDILLNKNQMDNKIQSRRKMSIVVSRRPTVTYVNKRYLAKKTNKLTLCDSDESTHRLKKWPNPKKHSLSCKDFGITVKSACPEKDDGDPNIPSTEKLSINYKDASSAGSTSVNCSIKECPKFPFQSNSAVKKSDCKKLSLWQKIVKYFQAREGCPTAEELSQKRLLEKAKKAALAAKMCLIEPKELERLRRILPRSKKCPKNKPEALNPCPPKRNFSTTSCLLSTEKSYSTKLLKNILTRFKQDIEILEKKGYIFPNHPHYKGYKQIKNITEDEFLAFISHQSVLYNSKGNQEDNEDNESLIYAWKIVDDLNSKQEIFDNFEMAESFRELYNKNE